MLAFEFICLILLSNFVLVEFIFGSLVSDEYIYLAQGLVVSIVLTGILYLVQILKEKSQKGD
jgi:uncharacterized membrane protein YcaP (DUF421 family)